MNRARPTELAIWMDATRAATWRVVGGRHVLAYAPEWVASPAARPLSLSLPLLLEPHSGPVVRSWFENLLPDDLEIRRRLARSAGADGVGAFELLAHHGAECAGAVQVLPPEALPARAKGVTGELLDASAVATHLRRAFGSAPASSSFASFRISLAGAHAKGALLHAEGNWYRPTGGTPSTHIMKPPLGRLGDEGLDLSDSVENEWLCGRVLRSLGLPVADAAIVDFDDVHVLAVARFDRVASPDGGIARLAQEDTCQALGVEPEKKYESEGGPGIRAVLRLLEGSTSAALDRRTFFAAQVAFWMLAAIDGHAKNFSVFIEPRGRFRLTPLYDVLSARPVMGRGPQRMDAHDPRLAMAVWGKSRRYRLVDIQRRHFDQTAKDCRLAGGAEPIIRDLIERVPGAVARVSSELPADFPSRVAEPILDGLLQAAEELDSMPAA